MVFLAFFGGGCKAAPVSHTKKLNEPEEAGSVMGRAVVLLGVVVEGSRVPTALRSYNAAVSAFILL